MKLRRNEKQNTQVIKVFPVSTRDKRLCRAEAWGSEGHNFCPFLRKGICALWGFDITRRPDKVSTCPVMTVVVPLPPD